MLGIHRAKGTPHALPDGSLRLGGNLLPHNMVHHGRKQVCIHLAIHPAHLGNHRPKFFIFAAQVFRFFLPVLKVHGLSFPVFFSCSVCWFLRLSCHHYTMLCAVWASAAKAYFFISTFPRLQQPAAPPWNIPTGRAAGCFYFCLFMGSVRGGSTRAGFVWALARPGAWKHSTALSAPPPQQKAEPDHSNHPAGRG